MCQSSESEVPISERVLTLALSSFVQTAYIHPYTGAFHHFDFDTSRSAIHTPADPTLFCGFPFLSLASRLWDVALRILKLRATLLFVAKVQSNSFAIFSPRHPPPPSLHISSSLCSSLIYCLATRLISIYVRSLPSLRGTNLNNKRINIKQSFAISCFILQYSTGHLARIHTYIAYGDDKTILRLMPQTIGKKCVRSKRKIECTMAAGRFCSSL